MGIGFKCGFPNEVERQSYLSEVDVKDLKLYLEGSNWRRVEVKVLWSPLEERITQITYKAITIIFV